MQQICLALPSDVDALLKSYQPPFDPPTGLTPSLPHDHIPIKPHTQPVNVRPYRYPHIKKKNEIECLVKEMLELGIIRLSTSPYSSRVLLVRKKDDLGGCVWIIGLLIILPIPVLMNH